MITDLQVDLGFKHTKLLQLFLIVADYGEDDDDHDDGNDDEDNDDDNDSRRSNLGG